MGGERAARARPGPLHLRRGPPNCATGSAAPPRTTRSPSTGSTRRRTRAARSIAARRREATLPRPHDAPGSTCSRARPAARSTTPSTGARVTLVGGAYWVIEDRLDGERATATTCAGTSRADAAVAATRAAPAHALAIAGAAVARGRLDLAALRRAARGAGRQRGRHRQRARVRHAARARAAAAHRRATATRSRSATTVALGEPGDARCATA